MKVADLQKLRQIIEAELQSANRQMLYKDTFATGCYLHRTGNKEAGRKLCYGVLDSLGFERRKTYFSQILNSLEGNEDAYIDDIWAHAEINALTKRNQQ